MTGRERLEFDDSGDGPAVVLIHGHPFDRSMWAPQRTALADAGLRVVAPDLRGYGASKATRGIVTMRELAQDILGLLDELAIERAAAVGLSMGGLVAMELAIATDRIWALGLVATTAEPPSEPDRARRLRLAEAAEREGMTPLVEAMRDALLGPAASEQIRGTVDRMMASNNPVGSAAALRGRAERPDYRPHLHALRLPTFVCAGTADGFSTAEVTSALLECLPSATTLLLLPEIGHLPNLEAPVEFNRGLTAFLLEHAPSPDLTSG
jgi:pimeloyl-ACP methyl ester carboxylesterase